MSTSRRSREPSKWALDAYEAGRTAGTPAVDATWFDLLTAAAFIIFAETQCEWAVIEVGLGGRLDSTNIVDGEIAVVTNIALEHTEILGHTRAAIAGREGRDPQARRRARHDARRRMTKPDASCRSEPTNLERG